LRKDYERFASSAEAFISLVGIWLLLARFSYRLVGYGRMLVAACTP
jgi:hypothetical protein